MGGPGAALVFRLLLVADNCSDDTAILARAAGADVIERDEPARRGKIFALGFAREALAADPPEIVLIVDADCTIDGEAMARATDTTMRQTTNAFSTARITSRDVRPPAMPVASRI